LDDDARVRPAVLDAIRRGVGFDVGHGGGAFSFDVARRALDQGLEPTTISSDIHSWNVAGPAFDLATTASKLLHLGLPLDKVLHKIAAAPAAAIGMADRIGTLAIGAEADVTLLRLAPGDWALTDAHRTTEIAALRPEPVQVVRAGHLHDCKPAAYPPVAAHVH
jgi:dihydroorotase